MNAGRADLIEDALFDRQTASEVRAMIESERPTRPAAASATPASGGSIFGGPTPAEADALTAAVRRRFEAMAKGGS